MSVNWKKYQNDPRYLIALLPGLEIARDNMTEEIDSIRAAISTGQSEVQGELQAPELEPARAKRSFKKAKKKSQKLLNAASPNFDSTGMTQAQFIAEVCRMHGGKATNEQLKNEASLHPVFHGLSIPQRLAVAIAGAIYTYKTVKRVAAGTLKAI